jgi:hypothetical protein
MIYYRPVSALIVLVFTLLLGSLGSKVEAGSSPLEGEWIGQYQTRQALHGQLKITVGRGQEGYELTVISSNEHYPEEEPEEIVSFSVGEGQISWVLFFGPTRVEWTGELRGDFLVGELTGSSEHHADFKGYWTAVRKSATVRPVESDSPDCP